MTFKVKQKKLKAKKTFAVDNLLKRNYLTEEESDTFEVLDAKEDKYKRDLKEIGEYEVVKGKIKFKIKNKIYELPYERETSVTSKEGGMVGVTDTISLKIKNLELSELIEDYLTH